MPSPIYDNAWLRARQQPQDRTVDIMHSPEEQARRRALVGGEGGQDQILDDARDYLSGAPDYSALASVPDRLAGIQAEQAASRPSLRGLTEPLATAGRFSTTASLPAAFVPGMQGLAAVMGAGGTALQLPDMLRRGYAPEEGEEAPGAMEAGFAGLGLIPGMSAARGTTRAFQAGRPLGPSQFGFRQAQTAAGAPKVTAPASTGRPSMDDPWSNTPLGRAGRAPEAPVANIVPEEMPAAWGQFAGKADGDPANISRTRTFGDLNQRTRQGGVQFERPIDDLANLSRERTFGDLRERLSSGLQSPADEIAVGPSGRALGELSTPGAQRYMNEQFAQNKETAFQTLGKQVDPDRALREAVEGLYAGPAEEVLSPLDRLSRIRERGAFARSRPQDVR